MASEEGVVIKVEESLASVKIVRTSGCVHCPSAVFCQRGADHTFMVKAQNDLGAQVGQRVRLQVAPYSIFSAAFILYLVPLFMMILGAVAGKLFIAPFFSEGASEIISAAAGLICMGGTYLGIRFLDRLYHKSHNFVPKIIQIL